MTSSKAAFHNYFGNALPHLDLALPYSGHLTTKEGPHGSLLVTHTRADPDYLVANGTVGDFEGLQSPRAIVRGNLRTMTLELAATRTPASEVGVQLVVVEFDISGQKLVAKFLSANMVHEYRPSPKCQRLLLAIRFTGVGEIAIERLSADGSARHEPGLRATGAGEAHAATAEGSGTRSSALADVTRQLIQARAPIPVSGETLPRQVPRPYRVAIITDDFMLNFWKDAFERLDYLSPSNYRDVLAQGDHDLLLYVTGWRGVANDEWRGIQTRDVPRTAFQDIVANFKMAGKPTVFQSIEDPSNFEYFLPIATQFDVVLTSDIDCVDKYREKVGHDGVHYFEYGVNPRINNPVGSFREALQCVFFAGSYPRRYPERCRDMDSVFSDLLRANVPFIIADRNFGNEEYAYPDAFAPSTIPPIPHDKLQAAHKQFRYNLNFNSIKSSPTMCAMRVYELQALGVSIVSNYADSVYNKFPHVRMLTPEQDLSGLRAPAQGHELHARLDGLRAVLSDKTACDRADDLLTAAGLTPGRRPGRVLVLMDAIEGTREAALDRQTYQNYRLANGTDFATPDELDAFCRDNDIEFLAPWDPDVPYERNYLQDRVNAYTFADVDYVTQLVDGGSYRAGVTHMHEFTSEQGRPEWTLYSLHRYSARQWLEADWRPEGARGYLLDPFQIGFPVGRRFFTEPTGETPLLSVIVPVYDNGEFLINKCLPSLQRNAAFARMQVVLVDDGSTDATTRDICASLAEECPNVILSAFDDGGSGSASRARNRGLELSEAPYVTFLDPDNEISPGGYDALLNEMALLKQKGSEARFVSGFQVKVAGDGYTVTGRHANGGVDEVPDLMARFLLAARFPVISTQAAVIEADLFRQHPRLRFVERAAGQDTLFGWELLAAAGAGAFTDSAHIVYYAGRTGSVTNTVDTAYFHKKLVLEREQVRRLEEMGVLELYRSAHLAQFVRGWYLTKLEQTPPDAYTECRTTVEEICRLYGVNFSELVEEPAS